MNSKKENLEKFNRKKRASFCEILEKCSKAWRGREDRGGLGEGGGEEVLCYHVARIYRDREVTRDWKCYSNEIFPFWIIKRPAFRFLVYFVVSSARET